MASCEANAGPISECFSGNLFPCDDYRDCADSLARLMETMWFDLWRHGGCSALALNESLSPNPNDIIALVREYAKTRWNDA